MQWLPEKWPIQILYLVYRWILALFFVAEIVVIGIKVGTVKFFIYLIHQSLTVFVIYTVWSAVAVTVRFLQVHLFSRRKFKEMEGKVEHSLLQIPQGCCGVKGDTTVWYQKIHWLLFVTGAEMALAVTLLQWLYRPAADPDANSLTHETAILYIVKGIVPVLDALFTSTPVRILHAIYISLVGMVYVVFHGIYFAANGTDTAGNRALYSVFSYGANPAARAGISVVFVLVYLPLIHLLFFVLYLMREAVAHLIKKKYFKPHSLSEKIEKDIELA